MKFRVALFAAGILAAPSLACAADAPNPPPATQAAAPGWPWENDNALLDATIKDVRKAGIAAVASHASDLEQALAGAVHSIELAAAGDGTTVYALSDNPTASIHEIMTTAADKTKKPVKAAFNPYPGISFFLGSYYDDAGKPQEALRALDAGLALPGIEESAHRSDLLVERGAALSALKRWQDALATYDAALTIESDTPAIKAYIQRGRGMALAQLGRMDDAKAAYGESLKLVSDDPEARKQLDYIRKLREGAGTP
jgi:tetratricopeptide (TPR) repeat protein